MANFVFDIRNKLQDLSSEKTFTGCAHTLSSLAKRADVEKIELFTVKALGTPATRIERAHITMHVTAHIMLTCVLSKEKFTFVYDKKHTLFLHNTPTSGDDDTDTIEHIHVEDNTIDLKEIAEQYIILGIPDFPTASQSSDESSFTPTLPKPQEEPTQRPFQGLENLLKKKNS